MMLSSINFRAVIIIAFAAFIQSCGGGGGGSGQTPAPAADTTPPVITISGNSELDVPFGEVYEDAGASAADNKDGTVSVSSTGEVNIYEPGTYTITYSATDLAGNSASIDRIVTVLPKMVMLTLSAFGDISYTNDSGLTFECDDDLYLCQTQIAIGDTVSVNAKGENGWSFEYWRGCDTNSGADCSVEIDDHTVLYATASSSDPVSFSSDVYFLNSVQMDNIVQVDPNAGMIEFAPGTDLTGIEPGNIIISDSQGNPDHQIMQRVVSINSVAGSITRVKTVPAALDDVVETGSILIGLNEQGTGAENQKGSFEILTDQIQTPKGVTINTSEKAGPLMISVGFNDVEIPIGGGVNLDIEGVVDFSVEMDFAYRWENNGFLRWTIDTRTDGNIDIAFDSEFFNTPANGALFPLTKPYRIRVPAGWLYLEATVQPLIKIDAELNVSLEFNIEFDRTTSSGVLWTAKHGPRIIADYSANSFTNVAEEIFQAEFQLEAALLLQGDLKIFKLAGPFIKAGVSRKLETTAVPFSDCPIRVDYSRGSYFDAGGKFELFNFNAEFSVGPFERYTLLKSYPELCAEDTKKPIGPSETYVTPLGSTEIKIDWPAGSDNTGINAYEVWRRDTTIGASRFIDQSPLTIYHDNNLIAGREYCYHILAVDLAGNRSDKPAGEACTFTQENIDSVLPTTPILQSISPVSSEAIALTWLPSEDEHGISQYLINWVPENSNGSFVIDSSNTTQRDVGSLSPGTQYCFNVIAVDKRGNRSASSDTLCEFTLDPDPSEPVVGTQLIDFQGFSTANHTSVTIDEVVFTGQDGVRIFRSNDIRTTYIAGLADLDLAPDNVKAPLYVDFPAPVKHVSFDTIRENQYDSFVDIILADGTKHTRLLVFDTENAQSLPSSGTGDRTTYIIPIVLDNIENIIRLELRPHDDGGMAFDNFRFSYVSQ